MGNRQIRYDEEFKRTIVRLREGGKSLRELKREYGVSESAVSDWCKRYARIEVDDEGTVMTMQQIKGLQKRLAEVEEENQILKKAAAIFLQHSK